MDVLRKLITILPGSKSSVPDAEQGLPSQQQPGSTPAVTLSAGQDEEKYGSPIVPHHNPVDPADKLTTFRLLAGISSHPVLDRKTAAYQNGQPLAPNLGIYTRVIRNEQNAKKSYKLASILINGCLGLQIVVAAALTAMGAANSSHSAITAFGAINTVIAAILTYLKGSGMPGRLKYYQNEWKRIREYIEQKERDFAHSDCPFDVHEIIATIGTMYEDTRNDIEANTPDSYHSPTRQRTATTNGLPSSGTTLTSTRHHSLVDPLTDLRSKYGDRVHSLASDLGHRMSDTQKGVQQHASEAGRHMHEVEHGIERARQDVEAFAKQRLSQLGDFAHIRPSSINLTISPHESSSGHAGSGQASGVSPPPPPHTAKPADA